MKTLEIIFTIKKAQRRGSPEIHDYVATVSAKTHPNMTLNYKIQCYQIIQDKLIM